MRIREVGSQALLIELDDAASTRATYAVIRRLIEEGAVVAPRDVVPGARTVLLDGVGEKSMLHAWRAALDAKSPSPSDLVDRATRSAREVWLEVRYNGDDLDVVAQAWRCSRDAVISRHQTATFTVAFCGFAPGFAYCTSDPVLPSVSRRDDPRTLVPAGAVGLAGEYCGVYPRQMPGGWRLIGFTDVVLFNPEREDPALLRPGDTVRFRERS